MDFGPSTMETEAVVKVPTVEFSYTREHSRGFIYDFCVRLLAPVEALTEAAENGSSLDLKELEEFHASLSSVGIITHSPYFISFKYPGRGAHGL